MLCGVGLEWLSKNKLKTARRAPLPYTRALKSALLHAATSCNFKARRRKTEARVRDCHKNSQIPLPAQPGHAGRAARHSHFYSRAGPQAVDASNRFAQQLFLLESHFKDALRGVLDVRFAGARQLPECAF